jgi:hypothetical protein
VDLILQELSKGNKSPKFSNNITFDKFCNRINIWNEKTTTSPSGRHLGHYKILLRLNVYNINNNNISKQILYTYYQMTNIMAKLGTTLLRWCEVYLP